MATYIRLSITKSPIDEQHPEYGAARLTVMVEESANIEDKIFVFQRHVPSAASGLSGEFFHSVAGLVEMANLPDEPSESIDEPFYRSSSVVLDFATNAEADGAAEKIKSEVGLLVSANDRMLDPSNAESESVEFGTAP